MKTNELMKKAVSTAAKIGFKLKKASPEILVVAGVVGVVASTVLACKATLKAQDVMKEHKETKAEIDKVKQTADAGKLEEGKTYTEEDYNKDQFIVAVQTGVKLAKTYAPAIILGTLSIGCMLASNGILRKRNIALAGAYTAIDHSFKEYRNRVVERFGKEVDKELRFNLTKTKAEEITTDENGKEKKTKKEIQVIDPNNPAGYSDYARIFDESNPEWSKDAEYNLYNLRARQQIANDMLVANGFLFLNDVYKMLGFPATKAGQVVGWVYDKNNPVGDNYVDFGIYDVSKPKARDFVNGYEKAIILDFNVDGNVWDLMS